jgi:hypothetical protein
VTAMVMADSPGLTVRPLSRTLGYLTQCAANVSAARL